MTTETDTTTETAFPNAVDLRAQGMKAVDAWHTSDREGAKGDALAIWVLTQSWQNTLFTASVFDKDGVVEATQSFDLDDFANKEAPPRNTDGSVWRAMQTAWNNAVFERLFGLDAAKITNADKTRLNRVLSVSRDLLAKVDPQEITLSPRNSLRVPTAIMVKAPDPDKAKESVIEAYERNSDKPYVLDGGKDRTIAALRRAVAPPKADTGDKGKGRGADDKGQTMMASIAFVAVHLDSFASKTGEAVIAPTKEMDNALFILSSKLDRYFKDFPLEAAKPAKPAKPAKSAKAA